MDKSAEDQLLSTLRQHWNEREGRLDSARVLQKFGDQKTAGDFYAAVLRSGLRGWQPYAANELHKIIMRDVDPNLFWLEGAWDYAEESLTVDPDAMTSIFSLVRAACADVVRKFFAERFIALCERTDDIHQAFGLEGLECIIYAGGAMHLNKSLPRISTLMQRYPSRAYDDAVNLLGSFEWKPPAKRKLSHNKLREPVSIKKSNIILLDPAKMANEEKPQKEKVYA